ncbi:hypothetical protein T12_11494 [Trichinella patagoniensis]|uniref:MULE transposase domain-containing protein n=1 Tax=Trichinella patagoniensis TaxID=990121 RepID=A0A0V0ZEC2_9BILA|nr:hypothetical protein T12_11494 [Trichinella patagoniensis]
MFDKGICVKSCLTRNVSISAICNLEIGSVASTFQIFQAKDNYNLIHEGRVYNLKRTNMEDKQCVCRRVKKGCRGSIHTNLDVDAILDCNPHADDCIPDNDIVYKMQKKNALKRRAAEELKTIPQIYHEEASSASADLETVGQFPTYKSKTGTKISKTSANSPVAGDSTTLRMTTSGRRFLLHNNKACRTWGMDGTFKIVPQWYQQLFTIHASKLVPAVYCLCTGKDIGTYGYIFQALIDKAAVLEVDLNPDTIICDFETALIPAIRGYFPNTRVQGCYFHFCQAVHRNHYRIAITSMTYSALLCNYRTIPLQPISDPPITKVVLNPDTIICDYETVMITANQGYFLNMRVQGCYVHFSHVVH